jgi:hydrogenase maturation protease
VRCLVVGLGNELIGDDAVGIRVARVLERLTLPAGVEVHARPALGLDLIDVLSDWERLVLVDAMKTGRPPGTCTVLDLSEIGSLAQCPACSHSFGVAEIVALAARLRPDVAPAKIVVVGVEARVLDRFGTALSDEVRAALPGAVDEVLRLVGASDATRAAARPHALELAAWVPGPGEI